MRRREAALLLVSAGALAYQVVLVRAFAIGQWHHFAYMVISIALLGFGASGTLLAALARRNHKFEISSSGDVQPGRRENEAQARGRQNDARPNGWHSAARGAGWFALSSTAFALALPASFWLAQKIPFDPYLLVWDRRQLLYLGGYYLVLFVPFFAAATAIGLALVAESEQCPRLYFYNLAGSGAGAALAVGLLMIAPVERALLGVSALAEGGAVLALLDAAAPFASSRARRVAVAAGIAAMAALTLLFAARPPAVRLSPYKGLSYALQLPAARVVAARSSALGRVDVVTSPAIRIAPGLSLVTPGKASPPPQLGLFVEAESAGAVTAFDGDTRKIAFVDWMTTAAPYYARQDSPQRVCVLGAGGGAALLLALRHGAQHVDAVELDANVIELMRGPLGEASGALYDRPEVRVHRAEARAYVEAAGESWDVIDVSLVDSFAASVGGVGAVGENYLYTREALQTFLRRLRPGGVLAITRWVRMPPRDELKLFATAIAALERMGQRPAERLALVRSWATATLLVKREPFTAAEIAALRAWADERLFDTAYLPGITPGEGNCFNVLERDFYAEGVAALLSGGARRERFFRDYAFYIEPATDDRPYFFHFFRWRALPLMLSTLGASWVPFVEWGYLILVATLAQAALLSALLIALPLMVLRRRAAEKESAGLQPRDRGARWRVFLYFLALGLGYLFVEMALIQRLVFLLANPIYAVAVVLAGLLLVSGLGSGWAATRLKQDCPAAHLACRAALVVAVVAALYAFGLRAALAPLLAWPLAARLGVALAAMLPLAAMGMPFPLALHRLGRTQAELLPWAWAVNGCASVVATPLATLLALGAGLSAALAAAAACYVAAAIVARHWQAEMADEPR